MTLRPLEDTSITAIGFTPRLEAQWAVFFEAMGWTYFYEHEGMVLDDGTYSLPDFWLPDLQTWVEIKPVEPCSRRKMRACAFAIERLKCFRLLHPRVSGRRPCGLMIPEWAQEASILPDVAALLLASITLMTMSVVRFLAPVSAVYLREIPVSPTISSMPIPGPKVHFLNSESGTSGFAPSAPDCPRTCRRCGVRCECMEERELSMDTDLNHITLTGVLERDPSPSCGPRDATGALHAEDHQARPCRPGVQAVCAGQGGQPGGGGGR